MNPKISSKTMQKEFESRLLTFQEKLGREPGLEFIKKLFAEFPKIEIYLVGGAVRDAAIGKEDQKDYDFVVRNIATQKLKSFLSKLGSINLVGKTFGVYKFMPRGIKNIEPIDIAFPRTEHAFGTGGYRDVKTQSDPKMPISKDLSRRDFTINAIAWDLKNKKVVDPFSGLQDLHDRKIKAVGDPRARFKEDYSRILRGLRFACQFNFNFDEKTFKAIVEMMPHLNNERKIKSRARRDAKKERVLPYEVVAKEFLKAFFCAPTQAFDLYDQTGAFRELMSKILEMKNCPQPPQFHSEGDVWQHTKLVLEKIDSPEFKKQFGNNAKNAELVVAALLHDIGKPKTIKTPERDKTDRIRFNEHDIIGAEIARRICKRLKFDSLPENSPLRVEPKKIGLLIQYHMLLVESNVKQMRPNTLEKYFFNPNFPGDNLLKLAFVDGIATVPPLAQPDLKNFYKMTERIEGLRAQFEAKTKLPPPVLTGNEIMAHFKLKPGPQIGELISELRNAQLDLKKPIKTKKGAYEFLKKYLKNRT